MSQKITVIIATYNGERHIITQLESILFQSRKPDEVIICDDCSTDNTPLVVNNFINEHNLDWKFNINAANLGYQQNFIQLILKSTGNIVFFSDQDDIWDLKKIEIMSKIMEDDSNIFALTCNRSYIDENGELLEHEIVKGFPKASLIKTTIFTKFEKPIYNGMCMAISRRIAEFISENTELFVSDTLGHDFICATVGSALNGFYFYNEVLAFHRSHSTSLVNSDTKTTSRNAKSRIKYLQKKLSRFQFAIKVYEKLDDRNVLYSEKKVLHTHMKVYERRLKNFSRGRMGLFSAIPMFRYVFLKYLPLKIYVKDVAYIAIGTRSV